MVAVVNADDALCRLHFGPTYRDHLPAKESPPHPLLAEFGAQLEAYCQGRLRRFDLPLAPSGTPFQQRAWQVLLSIPYGETLSYGEQAKALGEPGGAQAVGQANGANPIGLVIPCHRVIGANGSLTGFGGGLPLKRALLDFEQQQMGYQSLSLF
jgi:methylated-DNA-[protein]-cysteine S-methyltransferase